MLHIKKWDRHDSLFEQQMSPLQMAATEKTQNRHTSDVTNRACSSPPDKEEASSHCMVLVEEQQLDSTTKPDVRLREIAVTDPKSATAGVEFMMQESPVPRALQAFSWWVGRMMRYIPESTQIKALNAAKSTICDMLSEVMVATAVPPGLEAGFAHPVRMAPMQPSEDRDIHVVQFMDETKGGGECQATAI